MLQVDVAKINQENPLVKCPKCKSASRINLPKEEKEVKDQAWLVRHTETQFAETYMLKMGKNTIGRKADDSNYPVPNIQLSKEDDPYVSRGIHCTVELFETNGSIKCIISDHNSSNGTFLNGKTYRLKPGDEEYVEDGETIQVGRTKFVLKTSQMVASKNEAQTVVKQTNYSETMIA